MQNLDQIDDVFWMLTYENNDYLLFWIQKTKTFTEGDLELECFLELWVFALLDLRLMTDLLGWQKQESNLRIVCPATILAGDVLGPMNGDCHATFGLAVGEGDFKVATLRDDGRLLVLEVTHIKKMLLKHPNVIQVKLRSRPQQG